MNQELVIKIQVEANKPEEFLKAYIESLETMARFLSEKTEIPRTFRVRGTGVIAQADIQSTASHIDAIERQYRAELDKVKRMINDPNTAPGDLPQLEKVKDQLQAFIDGIVYGDDDTLVKIGS